MYRDPVPKNSWVFLTGGGSLYISSSKILGNTSDPYLTRMVFLMERSEG